VTRLQPVPAEPPQETVETMLRDLVRLIAETVAHPDDLREARRREAALRAARAAGAWRAAQLALFRAAAARHPMLPVAVRLARALAAGDQAGADVILHRSRTPGEWQELALILATAADLSRIAVPEAGAQAPADGARQALRRAS